MRSLDVMKKCLVFLLFFLIIYPSFTNAEAKLEVKVEYGVENKVQMGKGHPVKIEVINNGNAIKGDFVVFSNPTYNMAGSYIVPVEIGAGDTKIIELSVKGTNDYFHHNTSPNNKMEIVRFFEGGVETGKEVKLSGNISSMPRILQDNRLVLGVLSNNPDAVNYIKLLKYQQEPMEFLTIKSENIPTESFGLEIYDVILVHDFSLATLTDAQQFSLKEWVRSGGSIVFDTKIGLAQDLGELSEFLLLNPNEETMISSINPDSTYPGSLPVFIGNTVESDLQVLTKEGETPLTLMKKIGAGSVTQISSSLSSDAWKDWDKLNNWWSSVIQKSTNKQVNSNNPHALEDLSYQLTAVGEIFPGSIISVPLLIGAFIVYLILLIPVLYIILKKMDKREQAWWIIPTVAMITSISIFVVGAKDRIAGTQINDASILLLDNETELATGYGTVSILTNSGGKYKVEMEHKGTDFFPVLYGYNHNFDIVKNYAYLNAGSKSTDITFNDVEYWSLRSSIGKVHSVPLGNIDYDISVKEGNVRGKISNQLGYELTDVFLLSGRHSEKLGTVKAGQEIQLNYELDKKNVANVMSSPTNASVMKSFPNVSNAYNQPNPPKIDKTDLENHKKFQMLDLIVNRKELFINSEQPILVGFIAQDILGTKVNGKSSNQNSLHLVALPITIKNEGSASFSFTEENLNPMLQVTEGERGTIYHNGLDYGDKVIHIGGGSYTMSYRIPDMFSVERDKVTELKFKLRTSGEDLEYFVLNQRTNKLEPLENMNTVKIEGNLEHYIAENQVIQLVFTVPTNMDRDMTVPGIEVEGELKND
ncbi:hypothetical protein [Sutcliffiella halmapala]|uniref:hypothetical protein n=1 Tax=Sutcliffiella halmapala TaxID=79882 RepID=UPI00099570CC|nr:hypothetical protein [Sutcliffiella halmapala]